MPKPKPSPVARLMAAMDSCALARGEAQWLNGYRTAKGGTHESPSGGERLYKREVAAWGTVGKQEAAFRRLAQRIITEVRRG